MRPVLYSFRRCPYAMRARLAILYSQITIELREVLLKDIPSSLLAISPKATVPVLVFPDGSVMDESWDIMKWAVHKNDPDDWLGRDDGYVAEAEMLIEMNDFSFKEDLDHYKYADRYPEHPAEYYRAEAEEFLQSLEAHLRKHRYLLGDRISIADVGILPFIRQFAFVDKDWFDQTPYSKVQAWLQGFIESALFASVMEKYPQWQSGDAPVLYSPEWNR